MRYFVIALAICVALLSANAIGALFSKVQHSLQITLPTK